MLVQNDEKQKNLEFLCKAPDPNISIWKADGRAAFTKQHRKGDCYDTQRDLRKNEARRGYRE